MAIDDERLKHIERKIDRILSWAEGDSKLGTPSIKDQIDGNSQEVSNLKKKVFEAENRLNDMEKDVRYNSDHIKDQKRLAGIVGGGSAGGVFLVIEIIRRAVGM